MEIERKYLINPSKLPSNYQEYPKRIIEQGYLCNHPVVRIRRDDNNYYLTYKGEGMLVREEFNHPLTQVSYLHLLPKIDGNLIQKIRYEIPYQDQIIELDVFKGSHAPLILAEVEFETIKQADSFEPPLWFGSEVTYNEHYSNSYMASNLITE